jgi:ubiquinone/menaquinone biosynthesis C-methylase UbiE
MKRVVIPELLDADSGTPAEIAAALSDLRRLNRWFGGIATTQLLVEFVAQKTGAKSFSLLDVAAGAGDVPRSVAKRLKNRGIHLEVSLLDRAKSHLKNQKNGARAVAADALALPFSDASFDLVSCCLFAHHLGPQELLRFVNEALRVCRVAVLINDLIRHPLHLVLVHAGRPLHRSRLTRHDAPASVRAAYTQGEMVEILQQTRAGAAVIGMHYLFRMGVVVWRQGVLKR